MNTSELYAQSASELADGTFCGPDLSYDPEYLEFIALATPAAEQQLGDSVIPAKTPDWAKVLEAGAAILARSRDLRIIAPLGVAAVRHKGLAALADILELGASWLEQFWEEVHPRLEIDGEFDPLIRSNAISALADREGTMLALRASTLLTGPMGSVTIVQVERLLTGQSVPPDCPVNSIDQLMRMVDAERSRNVERFDAVDRLCRALERINRCLTEKLETEYRPALDPLLSLTDRIRTLVTPHDAPAHEDPGKPEQPLAALPDTTTEQRYVKGLPASIHQRSDAFEALALARKYFEEHEPSHPAPLIIRRIERLADLDFLEIIRELTPEGMQQLQVIAGTTNLEGR